LPSWRPGSAGRSLAVAVAALAGVACRHAALAERGLPAGWEALIAEPTAFAALYRLDCCGQRDLLATVRGDGEHLSIAIAAPPAGTVLEAFLAVEEGWITTSAGRCVDLLPPGLLPLRDGNALPLDPSLAASLLSGTVPPGAHELEARPGWVTASLEDTGSRWRIEGNPPRCTRLEVRRAGPWQGLSAELSGHHGRVPDRLVLQAGRERAELRLAEWRRGERLTPPAWIGGPPCGEKP